MDENDITVDTIQLQLEPKKTASGLSSILRRM